MIYFRRLLFIITFSAFLTCNTVTNYVIEKEITPIFNVAVKTYLLNYDSMYFSLHHLSKNHDWLTSKEELLRYASSLNTNISFDQYKYFRIEHSSNKRINIYYELKPVLINNKSYDNIKGIIGIYVPNYNDIRLSKYENKTLNISLSISDSPQESDASSLENGYSIFLFINNHVFKNKHDNPTMIYRNFIHVKK